MREIVNAFLFRKIATLCGSLLIFTILSACQKEETACILFCQGKTKVEFQAVTTTVNENVGTVRVYVTANPAPVGTIRIDYSLNASNTTASSSDYAFTSGTLTFNAGENSKYFEFVVTDDEDGGESVEYVSFRLGYPSDGDLGKNTTTTFAIIDNDVTDMTIGEGATQLSALLSCDSGSGNPESFTIATQTDTDSNCTLTAPPVQVSCTPNYKNDHTDWSSNIVVNCVQDGTTTPIAFTVNVTDTNQAPTASAISALTGVNAQAGQPVTITYATLMTAIPDEADPESDTLYLRIESIDDGAITVGGSAAIEGSTYLTSSGTNSSLVWTPSSSAQGNTAAFKIAVFDGSRASPAMQVTVNEVFNFVTPPAFIVPEGSVNFAGATALNCGNGGSVNPVFSKVSESSSPAINCDVTNSGNIPSYIECSPDYKSGQTNWSGTVTIQCSIGGTTVNQTATIVVQNTNRAPTLTGINTLTGASTNTPYNITFGNLIGNAVDISDPDADSTYFRVEAITGSGTLTKTGVAITPGVTTFKTGESLVYTPGSNDIGTIAAFTVVAYDGLTPSDPPIPVNIHVTGITKIDDQTINEGDTFTSDILVCDDGVTSGTPYYSVTSSEPETVCSIIPNASSTSARLQCIVGHKTTQLNWTSDITLQCDVNNTTTNLVTDSFTISVNNVNRAPTLTTINNLTGASFGSPFTITYTDLSLASTDLADSDTSDTLSFRIESVDEGTLTKNGALVVPGTTLLSAGEELVWTPAVGSVGLVTMFSVKAYDGFTTSSGNIAVKTELNGIIPIANLSTSEGVSVESAVVVCGDADGGTPAVSVTAQSDMDANCSIPVDKVVCTPAVKAGQSSWTSNITVTCTGTTNGDFTDVFTLSVNNSNQAPVLTSISDITGGVLNTPITISYATLDGNATVSDADLDTIKYRIESVISGTLTKNGNPVVNGTTLVGPGESVVWTPGNNNLGPLPAFSVVAHDGTTTSSATIDVNVRVAGFIGITSLSTSEEVLVDSGATSLEDLSICNDGNNGAGDVTWVSESDVDANCSVTAGGVVQCTPSAKAGQSNWSANVNIKCFAGGTDYFKTFTLNVTNANQPPTLTNFTAVPNHNMDTPLTITYGSLIINGDEADLDSDPLTFRIVSVPHGTMTKGGTPIVEGTTTIASGESVVWTPNAGTIGLTPAMYVRVSDGFNENGSDVPVNVEVRGFPTLSAVAATENVPAISALMICDDGTSPVGGPYNGAYSILIETDSDSNCSIVSNRLHCTPAYKVGQGTWSSNVTVQCNANSGAEFFTQVIPVNVSNVNVAPTLTSVNPFAGAESEVEYEFSHAAIMASAVGLDDPDGVTTQLQFRVESVANGSLLKFDGTTNTPVVVGTTTIGPGESFKWTSDPASSGEVNAFTIVAFDGINTSANAVAISTDKMMYFESLSSVTFTEGTSQNSSTLSCTDGTSTGTFLVTAQSDTNAQCLINGNTLECSPRYENSANNFSINWSSDVTIECTVGAQTTSQVTTVNITDVNREPTLTTISNIVGAISGEPYTITYADLLAKSNMSDPDTTDPLHFRVQAVSSGTLTKNGSAVIPGTTLLGAGESLQWTSAVGATGNLSAFTVVAWDQETISTGGNIQVTMESVFNFPDLLELNGTEGTTATSAAITCSNGTGNSESLSIASSPADTTCSINGSNQIVCIIGHRTGQTNWTENVTVTCTDGNIPANTTSKDFTLNVTNANQQPTLTTVTDFNNAIAGVPYTITFADLETNADEADADGDTVYFRIISLTNGTLTKNGVNIVPNVTTLSTGEELVWTPSTTTSGDIEAFRIRATDGFAVSSSDVAVNFANITRFDAIGNQSTAENSLVTISAASCTDGTNTHTYAIAQTDADANCSLSNTGTGGTTDINCTPNYKNTHAAWSADITVTCTAGTTIVDRTFTLTVTDVNQAPTLTTIGTMKRVEKDKVFSFTYATFLALTDMSDAEGDPLKFRIDTLEGSAMTVNGSPINAGTTEMRPGDTFTWTPPAAATGVVNAFTVSAYDNSAYSAASVQATVHVIDFTDFVDRTLNEGDNTNFGALVCDDSSGDTPTYSIVNSTDTDAQCTIVAPDSIACNPLHKSTQTNWFTDLTVRCTYADTLYAEQVVRVNVNNVNRAPTQTSFSQVAGYVKLDGVETLTLTYAQIAALGDQSDPDNDPLSFRIDDEYAANGTLEIDEGSGFGAATAGMMIDAGDVIRWTPNPALVGADTAIAQLTVHDDGGANSGTPLDLIVSTVSFQDITAFNGPEGTTFSSAALDCTDGSVDPVTYSVTAQTDTAITCSINTGAIECTPVYKSTHANWTSDVTIQCDISGKTFSKTVTVTADENNRAPIFTNLSTFTGAYTAQPYTISYADFIAASDISDPDGDPIELYVTSVVNGTLEVNGSAYAATTNDILATGQNFSWTPTGCIGSDLVAFRVRAMDDQDPNNHLSPEMDVVVNCEQSPALFTPSATDYDFGSVPVNEDPASVVNFTLTLTKSGEKPALLQAVHVSQGFEIASTTCNAIGTNQLSNCNYVITYTAGTKYTGAQTARFTLAYNDGYVDKYTTFTLAPHITAVGTTTNDGTFDTDTGTTATQSNPVAVAVGNLNPGSDFRTDIVVANSGSANISVLLPTATVGTFTTTNINVGNNPNDVAIADLNNDGHMDIIVVNRGDDDLSILRGDGSGTSFVAQTDVPIGSDPHSIVVEDFNGDGKKDIAVTDYTAGQVHIKFGNGDFTFGTTASVTVGTGPSGIAAGDLNNDGAVDLIVANYLSANATVLSNNGFGVFSFQTNLAAGTNPSDVAVGYLNADAHLDLVISNYTSNNFNTYTGTGAFGFTSLGTTSVAASPLSISIGNINGDVNNYADVMTSSNQAAGVVSVRINDGAGSFSGTTNLATGAAPKAAALSDINDDGKVDIIAVDYDDDTMTYLIGD